MIPNTMGIEQKPLDREKLRKILQEQAKDLFVDMFVFDFPSEGIITVFVKTTEEFIWQDTYIGNDLAWDYLDSLNYKSTNIISAKGMKGGLWYGSEHQ
ncbi:MAG: hypothetical protein FWG68_02815 [Defluviitaleaceae bacterium]|nr:hypothetical protein [Defluviitaleaceae bacterium]